MNVRELVIKLMEMNMDSEVHFESQGPDGWRTLVVNDVEQGEQVLLWGKDPKEQEIEYEYYDTRLRVWQPGLPPQNVKDALHCFGKNSYAVVTNNTYTWRIKP